ncbi:tryptophan synthase subunit alpha [Helicovermis profundi]|uniref:Tryptophan synthase alpha chain n=1 Tax=Helicovermis profundi TaxID=3065157 RepID=A0AAU9EUV4_9FIRM|nr:tryptophan synthase subunit alpha [Clostridia bacterium S502]
MQINKIIETINNKNRAAFMPFITAGFPSIEKNIEYIKLIIESGADILELGVPYSDPLADGEVIQNSSKIALDNGFKIENLFEVIEKIKEFSDIPIVIMTYLNSVLSYGEVKFSFKLNSLGVNNVIIPDLPMEEKSILEGSFSKNKINLISILAPTSKERTKKIIDNSSGFLYVVSANGTTGETEMNVNIVKETLSDIWLEADIPLALGFGISSAKHIEEFRNHSNGLIVGSAIIKKINECERLKSQLPLRKFINELSLACFRN